MLLFISSGLFAQHTLTVSVRSTENVPLNGATAHIALLQRSAVADSAGVIFFDDLPKGKYDVEISFVGFNAQTMKVEVPQPPETPYTIGLVPSEEEEEEVIVEATRSPRPFRDIPTRVEVISGEELAEKANMKPGDIRMMLSESTGIQTQQTSATSYNSSIRIQGLDGRYTQILKDGFPLYAGFSGGLSLMQVVPLDLKQVEVIKGSSSTLYGGGAIAGLVNLVSKTPTTKREVSFLANGTSAGGLDLSGYYSERYGTLGMTLLASRNSTAPFDPAGIGFTAIPKSERYTLNPRLYFYGKRTTANVGVSYIGEKRIGGSMDHIKRGAAGFYEDNNTDRFTSQVSVTHRTGGNASWNFKNSYSHFSRSVNIPGYAFGGVQQSTYSELTLSLPREKTAWIFGTNLVTDAFSESKHLAITRDYQYTTLGAFVQNTWSPSPKFSLETGLRTDYVAEYGFEWLPRASALWRISEQVTVRLGGGFGYKTPTIFNEESERIQFQHVLPINAQTARNERSVGTSLDVNYRTTLGQIDVL
ncbi:MAG: TonB-dependent receptor, partial [Chitinophagaceae bacterium]